MATSTPTTTEGVNPLIGVSLWMPIEHVKSVPVEKHHLPVLTPLVEDVGNIPEHLIVVSGRIEQGTVKVGDRVDISDYRSGLQYGPVSDAIVIAIWVNDKEVDSAHAPEYVSLALFSLRPLHVLPGQIVFKLLVKPTET